MQTNLRLTAQNCFLDEVRDTLGSETVPVPCTHPDATETVGYRYVYLALAPRGPRWGSLEVSWKGRLEPWIYRLCCKRVR